jgi:taurine dioxygenase
MAHGFDQEITMDITTEARTPAGSPSMTRRLEPRVTKLHPIIGAQVDGVDLGKPLDEDTVRLIRRAWAESIVLVFRNQTLTSADQRRFASYFGPVAERLRPPEKSGVKQTPNWADDLMVISNETNAAGEALGALGQGEMWFHTDKCYVEQPHRFSFLYGVVIPTEGGHTKFASLCEAYDRLPDQLKKDFEGKTVMQGHQYGAGRRIDINADLDTIHHHRQPLVVTNPDSGRKGLYISSQNTMWIEGMERADSEALLGDLLDRVESPDIIYEHVWQVGDLVAWDNLSCLHARTDWPKEQLRKLRRCTVIGDKLH